MLLPSLIRVLNELVESDHGAFFYCDANGEILNLYSEMMLSPAAMANYFKHHFNDQSNGFKQAFTNRLKAADPVSSYSLNKTDKNTAYYAQVLVPLQIEHFAYGIVYNEGRLIGQLSLYRNQDRVGFGKAELNALRDVLHYVGAALDDSKSKTMPLPIELFAEESAALVSPKGDVSFADQAWLRLTRMARGEVISPAKAAQASADTRKFIVEILRTIEQSNCAEHRVNSQWGEFRFRAHHMQNASGENALVLLVSRLSNDVIFAAQAAAKLSLPNQQREVAALLLQGKSNQEIAQALGVSVNTAGYHVKALFQRLKVNDRSQVVKALRSVM